MGSLESRDSAPAARAVLNHAAILPGVDECIDRMHAAGRSIGDDATSSLWAVIGSNGENFILATATSRAEA